MADDELHMQDVSEEEINAMEATTNAVKHIYIYGVTSLCCGPIQFSRLSPGSLGKNDKNMFFL